MLINPLGKTLLHFFLVEVVSVPFPYGATVETGTGTTVAVLTTTTGALDETSATLPPREETAPEEPEPSEDGVAEAVSVYIKLIMI